MAGFLCSWRDARAERVGGKTGSPKSQGVGFRAHATSHMLRFRWGWKPANSMTVSRPNVPVIGTNGFQHLNCGRDIGQSSVKPLSASNTVIACSSLLVAILFNCSQHLFRST